MMGMLRSNLHIFQLNITLNLFQIQIPLKKSIYDDKMYQLLELFNSKHDDDLLGVNIQMLPEWLVVAISSKIYTLSTLLFHKYIEENVSVTNCMSHFICSFQPRPLWNWLMETWDIPKQLELFYVIFLSVPLYIHWEQFIIVQVTLPTPSHQVPSIVVLVLKILHLKQFKTVISLTLRVVLRDIIIPNSI